MWCPVFAWVHMGSLLSKQFKMVEFQMTFLDSSEEYCFSDADLASDKPPDRWGAWAVSQDPAGDAWPRIEQLMACFPTNPSDA